MELDSRTNQKLIYRTLKSPRKEKNELRQLKAKHGDIITHRNNIMERCGKYFKSLLYNGINVSENITVIEKAAQLIWKDEEENNIKEEEVTKAIKQLKKG